MFYSHTGWNLFSRSGLVQLAPVHLAVLPHQQAAALIGSVFDARLSLEVCHGPTTTSSSLVQVDSAAVTTTSVVPVVTC